MQNKFKKIAKILLIGSFLSFLAGAILSGFPIFAFVWNIIAPKTSAQLSKILTRPVDTNQNIEEKKIDDDTRSLPEKNLSFSETPHIKIEKIGLDTEIIEKDLENYEEALEQGVWRVPDFGTPIEKNKPIILAAHRFGYLAWSQEYRRENSFFNLPDLEVGDRVEIVWDQRKFTYEIYDSEEAEDISNYDADLILYTCKFLESDIRIFRYARLVE